MFSFKNNFTSGGHTEKFIVYHVNWPVLAQICRYGGGCHVFCCFEKVISG